jgi:hypothetical protein
MTNQTSMDNLPVPPNQPDGTFAQAKKRLASNPGTAPEVLDKLASKQSTELSERIAENAQTDPATLAKLSDHDAVEVRTAVAENQNTSAETIQKLVGDDNPDVRYRLAENPGTSPEILEILAIDENPYVAARAQDTLKTIKGVSQYADEMLLLEDFVEAEKLFRKLVFGLEELLGPNHRYVARALHKLAVTLTKQRRNAEAQVIESRVQQIYATNP